MKYRAVQLDEKTYGRIDEYRKERSISRAATVRIIVNNFFLNQEKTT